MPWSPEHKQQTRDKILQSAAHLFTHNGFNKVSINQVMERAGLTRGAFYKHFNSKKELYSEAVVYGARRMTRDRLDREPDLDRILDLYLSKEHVNSVADACPLAFLVSDIALRDEESRQGYQQVLKGFIKRLAQSTGKDMETATIASILMVGGVALARAVDSPELIEQILNTAKAESKRQLLKAEDVVN